MIHFCVYVSVFKEKYLSAHATASRPTFPASLRRCAALSRQWLIYCMIVYFALLSVMDEDLRAFEKSAWNITGYVEEGVFKSSPDKRQAFGTSCHHTFTSTQTKCPSHLAAGAIIVWINAIDCKLFPCGVNHSCLRHINAVGVVSSLHKRLPANQSSPLSKLVLLWLLWQPFSCKCVTCVLWFAKGLVLHSCQPIEFLPRSLLPVPHSKPLSADNTLRAEQQDISNTLFSYIHPRGQKGTRVDE